MLAQATRFGTELASKHASDQGMHQMEDGIVLDKEMRDVFGKKKFSGCAVQQLAS
jgi:hypothetical protein